MTRDDVIRGTAKHIRRVGTLLAEFTWEITTRAIHHDMSKWTEKEWPLFEVATPKLASLTYGSEEYKEALESIAPALAHHYANNPHHPEHTGDIRNMSLVDLLEMLADWKAAGERHENGSMAASLKTNKERFSIPHDVHVLLVNTALDRAWISYDDAVQLRMNR